MQKNFKKAENKCMDLKVKFKNFTDDKATGFWFTVAICALSLVTSVVYAACYARTDNINWLSFAFMLAAFLGAFFMTVLKQYKYTPYLQAVFTFVSLLLYIYGIYYYVSVVMVGIDLDHFEPPFFITVILFLTTFGLSVANVFLKQTKENEKEVKPNENEEIAM